MKRGKRADSGGMKKTLLAGITAIFVSLGVLVAPSASAVSFDPTRPLYTSPKICKGERGIDGRVFTITKKQKKGKNTRQWLRLDGNVVEKRVRKGQRVCMVSELFDNFGQSKNWDISTIKMSADGRTLLALPKRFPYNNPTMEDIKRLSSVLDRDVAVADSVPFIKKPKRCVAPEMMDAMTPVGLTIDGYLPSYEVIDWKGDNQVINDSKIGVITLNVAGGKGILAPWKSGREDYTGSNAPRVELGASQDVDVRFSGFYKGSKTHKGKFLVDLTEDCGHASMPDEIVQFWVLDKLNEIAPGIDARYPTGANDASYEINENLVLTVPSGATVQGTSSL
jgi:hypothetical protein